MAGTVNDRVTQHARKVVKGKVIAGELHRLACQRHLNDLKKSRRRRWPYYYDEEEAQRAIDYAETLTIAEGAEPKPLHLIDEQAFDIGCTFGWLRKDNNKRRFRRRYKSVGRQNGKTLENGIMGSYIGGFGGYNYGKLFTVATKKRQARLAWEEMEKFIRIDPELGELFDVKDYKSLIVARETGCTIEALSKEAGLDDGFRSIFSSIDEIHQHKDNKIYKALYNGTRALPETLVSMITTRGDKLNSFCKEMDDYCINILRGLVEADDFFVDIYALDNDDDIWDVNNWIKANPYLCSTKQGLEQMKKDAQTAKDMGGSELRDFMTKCLNMWVQNTEDIFINPDQWKACSSERELEAFRGMKCTVGLDLSHGGDLTTFNLEFEDEEGKIYWYSHSFMPQGTLEEHINTDLAPYDLWAQEKLITITGDSATYKNDYKFIISELHRLQDTYNLEFMAIGVDPHNIDGIMSDLEEFGVPILIIVQSCRGLNDATEDIQLLVKSGKLEYNKYNELLTWSAVNAMIVKNSFGEKKIDKQPGAMYKRIDPIDAGIDAHSARLKCKEKNIDVSKETESYLTAMGW